MRISDWSSDVCSSDLTAVGHVLHQGREVMAMGRRPAAVALSGNGGYVAGARVYSEQALVSAAKRYLLGHLSEDLSAGELAFLLGVAEDRLSGAFSANLGMPVRSEEHTSELQSLMR